MQSLENKIESKLKEIDKMFDANALQANRAVDEQLQQEVQQHQNAPAEHKPSASPLVSGGMTQMKSNQTKKPPTGGRQYNQKPPMMTPHQRKLQEQAEQKRKREENAKAFMQRGNSGIRRQNPAT